MYTFAMKLGRTPDPYPRQGILTWTESWWSTYLLYLRPALGAVLRDFVTHT